MAQTPEPRRFASRRVLALAALALVSATSGWAAKPKDGNDSLEHKEFFRPELYISSSHEALEDALAELPNRGAWEMFLARRGDDTRRPQKTKAWIDPRSGATTNLLEPNPLIPGRGVGNRVTLADLGRRLGRKVEKVDRQAVADAARRFIEDHREIFGIDTRQLGALKADPIHDELWQVHVPQEYHGIPVRHGHFAVTINNGNVVMAGTDTWGDVRGLSPQPRVTAEEAMETGFAHADGRRPEDLIVREPRLEVVPVAPPEMQEGDRFAGPRGQGYRHRLVWTFVFQRPPDLANWEPMVDSHSGELIAFQDTNHYDNQSITGGVYPVTSTGQCPTVGTCGTMQSNWPMPFADTGQAAPNNFANSAGVFNWLGGTVTTTLTGKHVDIADQCGATSASTSSGSLNLGGSNNQHDCTTPGFGGAGNTASARSAFYEVNKIAEMARGWLPNNTWLQGRLTANVNINQTCNGFWNGTTINFYRSGGGCRNTGELAGVFDHEWGHGMDDNDTNGSISNSGEGYADIAAIYRYQDSCVGHGFFDASTSGSCGLTADGTGRNVDEDQTTGVHCATNCSGVRDADYLRHADGLPDTALGHVCTRCNTGTGPCGRQVHCAAAPQRQAAWDLVARDLTAAPFSYDSQTAFMIGNRLFYTGSGNIGTWYSCTCGSASSACGSTNGYMQWLAADDDNGNVNDGTPHMTAIYNAFNRHGIACSTPARANTGCSGQPNGGTGPNLTVTPGDYSTALSWTAVSGASKYWVLRTEGHAGCNYGKAKIAEVTGTSYTDTQVANGRTYYYNVVAVGSSNACFSRVSTCVSATPAPSTTPDFSVSASPASVTVTQGGSGTTTVTVGSVNGFASAVSLSCSNLPAGVSCSFNPSSVTPPANGSANSTLTLSATAGAATGTFTIQAVGTSGSTSRSANITLTVNASGGPVTVFFDNFETSTGWTRNLNGTDTATTGLWERADPAQTTDSTSGAVMQLGTTVSGTFDLVTAAAAGASVGANDIDGGVTTVSSPTITLPSTGTLTLSFSYYMAHLNNSGSDDFLRVYVVGSTTTQVFSEVGAADTDAASWATHSVNISSFAGQTVRIRIEAADMGTGSLVEAGIDDVRITQQ